MPVLKRSYIPPRPHSASHLSKGKKGEVNLGRDGSTMTESEAAIFSNLSINNGEVFVVESTGELFPAYEYPPRYIASTINV